MTLEAWQQKAIKLIKDYDIATAPEHDRACWTQLTRDYEAECNCHAKQQMIDFQKLLDDV